jgi:hypothetical protein
MSEILRLFFILILSTAGLGAGFLVLNALFPDRLGRTRMLIQAAPGRSIGIGLVNFAFFAVLAIALFSLAENAGPFVRGLFTIPAILITALLMIMLGFGLCGMAAVLGERIFPEVPSWKQILSGTVCLSFACALPFAGWFLLLPYTGFLGAGAFILSLFQRQPKS